jgi:TetR/AcrR family transcriptional regulator
MVNRDPAMIPRSLSPRRRDPDGTREALLAAGTALFAERGYDGTPVSAIAEAARVNKAMINYHFGGKRKLYLAIVTAAFQDIVTRAERLTETDRPAPDLLQELIALVAETATQRNPHFPAMMLREVLAGAKHLAADTIAYPLRVAEVVRHIVERGVREGSFRRVDPLLTHLTLVGSLLFFFATAPLRARLTAEGHLRGQVPDGAAYVRHIQELIIHGLAAPSEVGEANGGRPRARAR